MKTVEQMLRTSLMLAGHSAQVIEETIQAIKQSKRDDLKVIASRMRHNASHYDRISEARMVFAAKQVAAKIGLTGRLE